MSVYHYDEPRMVRKVWKSKASIAILALLSLYMAGPRVSRKVQIRQPHLPPITQLDSWLAMQEAKAAPLVPGTAKGILWAGGRVAKRPIAIVYLHGFSASRREISPVAERVAATLGANAFFTRLRGHGSADPDGQPMLQGSVSAWANDYTEAIRIGRLIGDRVLVIAVSTGATLALYGNSQLADKPDAMVLISLNLGPRNPLSEVLTLPWARYFAPLIQGEYYGFPSRSADHAAFWTHRYPTRALLPVMMLTRITRELPPAGNIPVLALYSQKDEVVRTELIPAALQGWPGAEMEQITRSQDPHWHVLTGNILSPGNVDATSNRITAFARQQLKAR